MIWIARLAAALVGLFSLAMGSVAILRPEQLTEILGLAAANDLGANALRADVGIFFLASAAAAILALVFRQTHWLYGAAFLYGGAAILRGLGIALDGAPAGVAQPIGIELVLTALALFAARTLKSTAP